MTIQLTRCLKAFALGSTFALTALLAGCGGGGGGGDAPPPVSVPGPGPGPEPGPGPAPDIPLALMVDSMGRQLPEAEFGMGDAAAAGADGIAFDGAPIANAPVTLTDSGGIARTGTTDASGYYRIDIKSLRPPLVVKVKRADGSEWFSATTAAPVVRGFLPVNVNGLTDKTVGFVADALNIASGAASAVTAPALAANPALLDQAKAKLRTGLAVPLVNAGFESASYDPVTTPMVPASADKHAAFLRDLQFSRDGPGRTGVIATISGPRQVIGPNAVAIDGAGNLYVADGLNRVIRKISASGLMTTLAGSGSEGFADGAGAAASFRSPAAIALGADGSLYVADQGNHAIRKVSAAGVVTTIAGAAGSGFVDGAGNVAKFFLPRSIAVDGSGNVYVTDLNFALRRVTPAGVVTTLAGYTPQQPYVSGERSTQPSTVAVDGAGNVYFADSVNKKIVRIAPNGVTSGVYLGAADALLPTESLAVDAAGTVYAGGYFSIVRITAGVASTLAGGTTGSADGNGTSARFGSVGGIALDANGDVLAADVMNRSIRRIAPNGDVTTVAGKASSGFADGPATSAKFSGDWSPVSLTYYFTGMGGVAVDAAGDIYVADTGNHAIRRIARSGTVTTVAGTGAPGFVNGNGRSASFNSPSAVAVDGGGNVYVADGGNKVIRKISPIGDVSTLVDSGPHVAASPDGTVYFAASDYSLRKITPTGAVSTVLQLDNPGTFSSYMLWILGELAVDQGGAVHVAGTGNVFAVSADGVVTRRTSIDFPWTLDSNPAVDREGNLYYVLSKTQEGTVSLLVKLSPSGVATYVQMDAAREVGRRVRRIAVDGSGNVVVTDPGNSVISIVLP